MRSTRKYLCSYYHDGGQWSVTIDAYDMEDAEARCKKLGYLKLDGELVATLPARAGLLVRIFVWLVNLGRQAPQT